MDMRSVCVISAAILGTAFFTKPDVDTFGKKYKNWVSDKLQEKTDIPKPFTKIAGKVINAINDEKILHNDYLFFRVAQIPRPGPHTIFVGLFGKWYCIQDAV